MHLFIFLSIKKSHVASDCVLCCMFVNNSKLQKKTIKYPLNKKTTLTTMTVTNGLVLNYKLTVYIQLLE